MKSPVHHRGFTLVELLVVTGLIAALLALVTVGFRPNVKSQLRRSAQQLTSAFLATQTRALGKPEGAGLILLSSGTLSAQIVEAHMQPLIRGRAAGVPPANPADPIATITFADLLPADVLGAYKIMFFSDQDTPGVQPNSCWWEFSPPGSVRRLGESDARPGAAAIRTPQNTVWPRAVAGGPLQVLLARYPLQGPPAVSMDKPVAIDMRFSGVGNGTQDSVFPYARFANDGSIAITFDQMGQVGEVMMQVLERSIPSLPAVAKKEPIAVSQTLFFLLAPRDEIEAGANTLANPDALWVSLSPATSRWLISANVAQSNMAVSSMNEVQLAAAIYAARDNAINGIPLGR